MSGITTHVLDTSQGTPAGGVTVRLDALRADEWVRLAEAQTDEDGRVGGLLPGEGPEAGTYRIRFEVGEYFRARGVRGFYPEVTVVFEVTEAGRHHHVPLLLSPFGYATYRGS